MNPHETAAKVLAGLVGGSYETLDGWGYISRPGEKAKPLSVAFVHLRTGRMFRVRSNQRRPPSLCPHCKGEQEMCAACGGSGLAKR